jgi:uncharacterized protein with von Willebrand factor type A (vWA) domain
MDREVTLNRWRLVLGKYAAEELGEPTDIPGEGIASMEVDQLLEFLYGREYNEGRGVEEGSQEASALSVPHWLNRVQQLFPKEVTEKLEAHALERYGLTELLRDARVLAKLEPNLTLLKQIISLKHMMKGETLNVARRIVRQVVEDLTRKMQSEVRQAIMGKRDRNRSTPFRSAKNFDFKKTIRKNLKNFDAAAERLVVENVYFYSNLQRYNTWHVILCVDESGSMMENVIHAAVMAGVFAGLPVLSVKLIIFDTQIVDLTGYVDDPVAALMSIQLGGGTDIGKALAYCAEQISVPQRTIVVLISDLCDGGGYKPMYAAARGIIEGGSRLICLTSLDRDCAGMYDKTAAKNLATLGASVAALTPLQLADWIGDILQGGGR